MNLIFFISFRYFISKKQNKYSTFTSLLAIIGISLGLITLIVSSNIMEGFKYKIKEDILLFSTGSINTDIIIPFTDEESYNYLKNIYINNKNVINIDTINKVYVSSLLENEQGNITRYSLKIVNNEYLKNNFQLKNNQLNKIIVPKKDFYLDKSEFLLLTVIDHISFNKVFQELFEYEKIENINNIYISEEYLKEIDIKFDKYIYITLDNKYNFNSQNWLINNFTEEHIIKYEPSSWDKQHTKLFEAIQFEALILKIITFMIIVSSSFNIISTIVMIIYEKKNDISLLMTYGFEEKSIVLIFLNIGILIGISGIVLGNLVGYLISVNINEIVLFIENYFNLKIVPEAFRINNSNEIITNYYNFKNAICFSLIIIFIVIISSIIPAISSQKIDPSEVLKDE